MEMLSSAVVGELVSRSISFLFSKLEKETTATVQENLQRLRHLLLRSGAIVHDAEQRHFPSKAMLQQLKALRDETFRGYYVLDAVRCRPALGGGDRRRNGKDGEEEEKKVVGRRALSLSRFNPAKRVRFASDASETESVLGAASPVELQQVVRSLEVMIGDMKEFVMFLASYAPLYRQPYSVHMFLEKCMFGRHMEKKRVMEFLLKNEPPPGAENLDVLPIVGPAYIGKSTLVEYVCQEDKVRNHFSLILVYSRNCLKDETAASFRDNCLIKHQNDNALEEKVLIVIELSGDVDDETWERLYSSERSMPHGSKMIITSRLKEITSFGTTQALSLKCLPTEAYWYFFKRLAFGSEDPEQHPELASIAMEMAHKMQGSFMYAHIGSALLRADFSIQSWSVVLTKLREFLQKNISLLGEEYPDDLKAKDHPQCTWNLTEKKPDEYFMLYEIYPRGSGVKEVPDITMIDLLFGCAQPRGKY